MGDTRQDLWQMGLSLKTHGKPLFRSSLPETPKTSHSFGELNNLEPWKADIEMPTLKPTYMRNCSS